MSEVVDEEEFLNTKFECYGHLCELQLPADELDELRKKGVKPQLKRIWRYVYTVNGTNARTRKYLRSQASVEDEIRRHMDSNYYIVHPLSRMHFWWQSVYAFVIMLGSIFIPLDKYLMLPFDDRNPTFIILCYVSDLVSIIDIMVNFITGYYDKNIVFVIEPSRIAVNYLFGTFVFNLFCSIPYYGIFELYAIVQGVHLESICHTDIHTAVEVLNVLHYFRMFTAIKYFREMGDTLELESFCKTMFEMLVLIIITMHWLACGSVRTYPGDNQSLTANMNLHSKDVPDRYTLCVHRIICFAAGLNTNWGMMDHYDYMFTSFSIVVSRLLVLMVIGQMVRLLQGSSSSTVEHDSMVSQLEYYMRYKKLPEHIRRRVRRYYVYRFNRSYFREDEIINSASGQLRQDLIMNNCRRLLQSVVLFKDMPYALLQQVVLRLQNEVFTVNEVILRAGAASDCMYFIATGTVAIYSPMGREVCHMEDGDFFGEIGLLDPTINRTACVVAVESCNLYRLDREDFEETIAPFPDLVATVQRVATERQDSIHMADMRFNKHAASG